MSRHDVVLALLIAGAAICLVVIFELTSKGPLP